MNQPMKKRITAIDAIRGFSLFGILVVNMLSFHSPHFMYGGKRSFYESLEANGEFVDSNVLLTVIDLFFQASFYPLFSLLFGIGLWMMYQGKETSVAKKVLTKRLFILMVIGLLHGIFIWHRDILLTYSIIGMISILFLNHSTKTILTWAVGLLGVRIRLLTLASYSVREQMDMAFQGEIIHAIEGYRGSYFDSLQQNLTDWLVMVQPLQMLSTLLTILPMFLIGMVIGRSGVLSKPNEHLRTIMGTIVVTFIIFVIFKGGPYLLEHKAWLNVAQDTIGGSASAIFYFFVLLLLFSKGSSTLMVRLFSSMGKLSLTNYLLQSIIGVSIFYGFGLSLYGTQPLSKLMLLVLIIYIIQLILSFVYLKKFRYGPMEWIYRSLTYGKKIKIKIKKD